MKNEFNRTYWKTIKQSLDKVMQSEVELTGVKSSELL